MACERDGIVASISYGFDRKAPMAGPYLDSLHRRASYAKPLLKLTEELLFSDPNYVARLDSPLLLDGRQDRSADLAPGALVEAKAEEAETPASPMKLGRRRCGAGDAPTDTPESTCWTVIGGPAVGAPRVRDESRSDRPRSSALPRRPVHASAVRNDLDDAVQDVFLECLTRAVRWTGPMRDDRALPPLPLRRGPVRRPPFRGPPRDKPGLPTSPRLEETPDADPAFRFSIVPGPKLECGKAAKLHAECAGEAGPEAMRRVELLPTCAFTTAFPSARSPAAGAWTPASCTTSMRRRGRSSRRPSWKRWRFHRPGSAAEVERECTELRWVDIFRNNRAINLDCR